MLRADPLHPALAAVLLGATVVMGLAEHLAPAPRAALVVGYLLLAPGYALLPFFGRQHWLLHALLVLSFGVALAVVVATFMGETGWWHVRLAVGATELVVVGAVVWRTWRNRAAVGHLVGGVR